MITSVFKMGKIIFILQIVYNSLNNPLFKYFKKQNQMFLKKIKKYL